MNACYGRHCGLCALRYSVGAIDHITDALICSPVSPVTKIPSTGYSYFHDFVFLVMKEKKQKLHVLVSK